MPISTRDAGYPINRPIALLTGPAIAQGSVRTRVLGADVLPVRSSSFPSGAASTQERP